MQKVRGFAVMLEERPAIEFGIGNVAPTATADIQLFAQRAVFFQYQYSLACFRRRGRRHHPGRPAPNNEDIEPNRWGFFLKCIHALDCLTNTHR